MDNMIPIQRELKRIQNLLKTDQPTSPQFVLIGHEGAGKTSILENVIGFRAFPPESTCCPVIVRLKNIERGRDAFTVENATFAEPAAVQNAVQTEMDRNVGKQFCASMKPIFLEFESSHYVDLTIVDLPGIPHVGIGDPSSDTCNQLKKLCLRYMNSPNAIILVVVPATLDLTTNDCLKFVRSAGFQSRAIVVVNKLDTVPAGMDLLQIFTDRIWFGFLKVIGVVSKFTNEKRKPEDLLKKEKKLLQSKWPSIARDHGNIALQSAIANILRQHLKSSLTDYRSGLSDCLTQTEKKIGSLGAPSQDPDRTIIEEATRYASAFCSLLSGKTLEIETETLVGGARIGYIFREIFNPVMEAHNALNGLSRSEILIALRNACGTRPEILFIPETCFESLARRQVNLLAVSCRECVDLVLDEMIRLSKDAASPLTLQRFPALYELLFKITVNLIEKQYRACCDFVEELLTMELGYVNTLDSDFQEQVDAAKMRWLAGQDYVESKVDVGNKGLAENSSHWFSSFLRKDVGVSKSYQVIMAGALENTRCEILENLLVSYTNIVRKSLKDATPKAIMLRLVNYVNDHLYAVLLEELQREKLKQPNILTEPENYIQKRRDLTDSYKKLQIVQNDLKEIQEQLQKSIT